jgi:hypothetical protein
MIPPEQESYDEEKCDDDYYQDHIEERNSDIRKQLHQRSQPARTLRRSRWEKKMQLRRKQKEEQATDTQIIIYERDGTTARAKEQGRQEEEGDHGA